MIERCHVLLQGDGSDGSDNAPPKLRLNGSPVDLAYYLEKCMSFDRWDRVCHDATLFALDVTTATTRRGMSLDHMLA